MKTLTTILLFACAISAFGQATAPSGTATPGPTFAMPGAVAVFGAFNQLGTPRWTGGFSAIYPMPVVPDSLRMFSTTTADVYPKKAVDPATGRPFYAISATVRQGFHRDLLDTSRWSFLLGGDVGPGFSQAQPSGINVSLSGSFVATAVCQVTPALSTMFAARMLYMTNIGWNPIGEAGVILNIKKLPKAKAQ